MLLAHSVRGAPECEWETLDAHLRAVAEYAGTFARAFQAEEWGRLAGLWHDLGKARPEFQARLRGERVQTEHAGAGAAHAISAAAVQALPLAFAIAAHHSGLPNWRVRGESGVPTLEERVERNRALAAALSADLPDICARPIPELPPWLSDLVHSRLPADEKRRAVLLALEQFTRFLLSALVDADRLATERFYGGVSTPEHAWPPLDVLDARLDSYIADKRREADSELLVNRVRDEVLSACCARSRDPQGIFTLTVPTGGGKTLSAMSFALKHAVHHDLRGVIVVLPFTSIIEQNARVYREALGKGTVLEHHCNLDETRAAEEYGESDSARQRATENWDAPVIVTTTVQFLESLFSNRPFRCRKLHNIARRVIVLDEVQSLPPPFLSPILSALNALQGQYGCTLLLTTATPPALARTPQRPFGLFDTREIMPDVRVLAERLRRVAVRWPASRDDVTPYETLGVELARHRQVLAIVHLRRDARQLASLLPPEGRFHLSALMCPAHRLDVLSRVRQTLREGVVCRVVSTQLVEAGVDIDFPVVFRALAGVDSLAQAAGRCNREGRRRDADGREIPGQFVVFRAPTKPPAGVLRMALESTESMLAVRGSALDLHDPAVADEFFNSLYFKAELDREAIERMRRDLNFADVSDAFRIIDDYTRAVIVPYGLAYDRVAAYRRTPDRLTRRALQVFAVSISPSQCDALDRCGALEQLDDEVRIVSRAFPHLYDPEFGLRVDAERVEPNPAAFVV